MKLCNRIRRVRLLNQLSQADVCKGIISTSHYSNVENGRYHLTKDTLSLLAKRLSVPTSYLTKSNEENIKLGELLKVYEENIKTEDIEELNLFIQVNKEKLEFIPSLKQEFHFTLLRFIHLFKSNKIKEAKELYSKRIINMKDADSTLSSSFSQKYFYVSALYYYFEREWMKSIFFFKEILQTNKDPLFRAKISYNISLALYSLFNYEEALEYAKEAKKLYLNLHNWIKTGECYNLIAILFREKKLLIKSEEYINKGLHILGEDSNETSAKLYHNLALIRLNQENYKEALKIIKVCIGIKESTKSEDLFISYRTKLNILLKMEDILSLKRTLKIADKQVRTSIDKSHFLFIKAQVHYLLGEFTSYEESIKISIESYLSQGNWKVLELAAEHYSTYLGEKKRYKHAFYYQKTCTLALKNL